MNNILQIIQFLFLLLLYMCTIILSKPHSEIIKSPNGKETILYLERINSNETSTKAPPPQPIALSRIQENENKTSTSNNNNPSKKSDNFSPSQSTKKTSTTNKSPLIPLEIKAVTNLTSKVIPKPNETLSLHLETLNFQQEQPPSDDEDFFNFGNENNTEFKFRGPNFNIQKEPVPTITDEDRIIREAWGGNCVNDDWKRCNHITGWGGNYTIQDKKNPGQFITKYHVIPCFGGIEKVYCLTNKWSVARCHMLCMSQCNIEYRQKYDKFVQHEGECAMPIG